MQEGENQANCSQNYFLGLSVPDSSFQDPHSAAPGPCYGILRRASSISISTPTLQLTKVSRRGKQRVSNRKPPRLVQ